MSTNKPNDLVLIFDFDGTIADTMALVSDLANELLPKYGRQQGLSKSDIKKLREMSIPQGLKFLGVPAYRFPQIALEGKQLLSKKINQLQPIDGMVEVLKYFNEQSIEIGILTSNSRSNVMKFLRKHNLKHLFSFIDAGVSVFGKSRHLKTTLKRQKLTPEQCLYVGDEIRDIEASKSQKIPCISVTWGVNTKKALAEREPLTIVETPKQLKSQVEKILKERNASS